MTKHMELEFVDRSASMVRAWQKVLGHSKAKIRHGDLLKTRADAILCPANSFGDMGGGVDRAIDLHFNRRAQPEIRAAIEEHSFGELPVGLAIVVPLQRGRVRHLVVAPTMRVPGNVSRTLNAYLAFRAALVAVTKHNLKSPSPIALLATPGLCTGVGGMAEEVAADQMAAAHRSVILNLWRDVKHPAMAPFALHES